MPDLEFATAGRVLAGSLALPPGDGPFPAALLIPGSGPLDRDSNHRRLRLGVTRELADALAAHGVASLRYDKRGVGASGRDWRAAGLADNVMDARAALDALRARPEVDAKRLFVIGHSEGAIIAAALAAGVDDLAGVVLLAGSARSGEDVLRWQLRAMLPTIPRFARALMRLTRTDLVAKQDKSLARIKQTTTDVARISMAPVNARWMREFMAHDPREDLARISVPVLAITGGKDLQADPADLDEIARCVTGPVETHRPELVTHTLRSQPGPASLKAYRAEVKRPIDSDVRSWIVSWVQNRA